MCIWNLFRVHPLLFPVLTRRASSSQAHSLTSWEAIPPWRQVWSQPQCEGRPLICHTHVLSYLPTSLLFSYFLHLSFNLHVSLLSPSLLFLICCPLLPSPASIFPFSSTLHFFVYYILLCFFLKAYYTKSSSTVQSSGREGFTWQAGQYQCPQH